MSPPMRPDYVSKKKCLPTKSLNRHIAAQDKAYIEVAGALKSKPKLRAG
jgi:hypothetical protein